MSKEKSAIERRSEAIAGVYAGFSKKLGVLQKRHREEVLRLFDEWKKRSIEELRTSITKA